VNARITSLQSGEGKCHGSEAGKTHNAAGGLPVQYVPVSQSQCGTNYCIRQKPRRGGPLRSESVAEKAFYDFFFLRCPESDIRISSAGLGSLILFP